MILIRLGRFCRRNPGLAAGLCLLLALAFLGIGGRLLVNVGEARALSAMARLAPCMRYPFGTDDWGRNLFAVMVVGVPMTLWVGVLAGIIGLGIGVFLGFLAGYLRGGVDAVIRGVVDTLLTVPGLVVLVSIASTIREEISLGTMALVVAALSWMYPTRTIRAQVLSLRDREYVQVAKLNGMGPLRIIAVELLPNMLPYLAASFIGAVASAVLATVYLEALGLGPQNAPTVGMTIYWAMSSGSVIRGLWWWWFVPIVFLVVLFVAMFLVTAGMDAVIRPRLRRQG